MSVIAHASLAVLLSLAIVTIARHARSLSRDGSVAAFFVGTMTFLAGFDWAALLIAFFVTSSAWSRFRREARSTRIGDVVEKGGARDAVQVLANGGVFAMAAAGSVIRPASWWTALGAGALAAATADTWATELGTLAGRAPRSILSGKTVPPGMSGGVTWPGTLASIAGAAFIALVAVAVGYPGRIAAGAVAGGVAGSLVDSLVGASLQERRWCDICSAPTERRVHACGARTRLTGGVPGMRNDSVNVLCSVTGALACLLVSR
jgi:uncharacterized protein (TIGR00297 family)